MKKSLTTKLFATIALGLTGLSAWAVMPEAGKVYRIINTAAGTAVSDRGPTGIVGCSAVNETNMSQRWLASAGKNGSLVFRSLGTGMYLKSSNARSQAWTLSSVSTGATSQLAITGSGNEFTVKASGSNDQLAMHRDGSSNIVCWDASNPNSKWDFTVVEMTQAEIDAALAKSADMDAEAGKEATYQAALDNLFSNKQCTVLKPNYQSMSDDAIKADSNYKALSATLQQMVLKVKNGNWAEGEGNYAWDSEHAKKYRVQSYEPASEGASAANLAGIQAYTNMHNPTGILGNSGGVLYVMVENVPDNENVTLYISGAVGSGMFNNTTDGTQLHEGLNVIPQWSDCAHQFVYYTVQTTKWEGNKLVPNVKVTDFDPIQIHIEGGELNGYFNFAGDELYTPDTYEDFKYTSARAKHEMYDLLGEYVILHFHLFDTPSKPGNTTLEPGMRKLLDPDQNPGAAEYDVTKIMKVWDELCFRERTIMGIQSDEELARKSDIVWGYYEPLTGDDVADPGFQYSDYFNNRMMGITMQGDLYMNATSWRTAYNVNTMGPILNNITTDSGSTWGPAHEYGHMNQTPMKFAGTTEESNNIFSNVVAYYFGKNTSRAAFPKNQLEVFNRDATYLENDTWGTTRMFLQLWLYYHACGHNKKFYPRLYELLRQNPRKQSYYLNMRYDQLHFAKMCCIAAQEDLTDYFESWGFFVPLDNYHIGDYSNWMATLTPEDAQAVKDEIKALGLPKNNQIILIDDRPGSERDSWWGWPIEECGPMGGIKDFQDNVQPTGELSFSLDGSNMVVNHENGTGGVGFLVYDNDGTLLSFSNDYTFPLKNAAVAALMAGTAKVYAIGADGKTQEVANNFVDAPVSDHQKNLTSLINSVEDVYNIIDPEGLRANWYMEFYAKSFVAAYDAAKEGAKADDITKEEITRLYLNLLDEYNALKAHGFAKVRFIPGSTYQFINSEYPQRTLALATKSTKVVNSTLRLENPAESQQWKFVTVNADENRYKIQNVATGKYMGPIDPSLSNDEIRSQITVTTKASEAGIFTLRALDNGAYAVMNNGDDRYSIHIGQGSATGPVMQWGSDAGASQWYLRLLEPNTKNSLIARLEQLLAESEDLLSKAGTFVINGENIELTGDMYFSNAKCTNEQFGDQFTSFDVLCDNNSVTYFHSNYGAGNTEDGKNHYIGIDLGEGKSLNSIQINWLNRDTQGSNAAVQNPRTVRVQGSNDKVKWTTLATLQNLPASSGGAYTSPVISDGNDYRYFRIECTQGGGDDGHGHQFFALAELGIGGATEVITPDAAYPKVTVDMMTAVRDQNDAAATVLGKASSNRVLEETYNALWTVYAALAEAMGVETGIDEITVDGAVRPAAQGVYDLQGRRLNRAGKGGIYIIDGQKTLVK